MGSSVFRYAVSAALVALLCGTAMMQPRGSVNKKISPKLNMINNTIPLRLKCIYNCQVYFWVIQHHVSSHTLCLGLDVLLSGMICSGPVIVTYLTSFLRVGPMCPHQSGGAANLTVVISWMLFLFSAYNHTSTYICWVNIYSVSKKTVATSISNCEIKSDVWEKGSSW